MTLPVTTHELPVPGAVLHYEVRGTGPVVVLIGSPMAAADFEPLAEALAADHTVVTMDPRGYGASAIDDPDEQSTPDLRARDVVAVLDDLRADVADVMGSSGGAVTALALAAGHPDRVRTLVAHEPPLTELLADPGSHRASREQVIDTFHRDGVHAAWRAFMVSAGFEPADVGGAPPQPTERERQEAARFFDHDLRATTGYVPDVAALRAGRPRVVVGVGVESQPLLTYQTSTTLAALLGMPVTAFPGGHVGFLTDPPAFAAALRASLLAQA